MIHIHKKFCLSKLNTFNPVDHKSAKINCVFVGMLQIVGIYVIIIGISRVSRLRLAEEVCLPFGCGARKLNEDEDRAGEGGQVWAGCSLQGYCFFRVRTTCLPLRRAIELEMRRDGQMEMWRGGTAGEEPMGQNQTKSLLSGLR